MMLPYQFSEIAIKDVNRFAQIIRLNISKPIPPPVSLSRTLPAQHPKPLFPVRVAFSSSVADRWAQGNTSTFRTD